MPAPLLLVSFPRLISAVIIAVIASRCRLVNRLGALHRLLWVQLNRRADVLKVEVELVDNIQKSFDIVPLEFLLPGGELEYYVKVGNRISGVANRLHPDALVGAVTRLREVGR